MQFKTICTKDKDSTMSTNVHITQQENFFIDCLVENLDQCFPAAELDVMVALGKVSDIQRYLAAQEAENYAEDVITMLEDKSGQPAGTTLLPSFPVTDSKHCFRISRGHCSCLEI